MAYRKIWKTSAGSALLFLGLTVGMAAHAATVTLPDFTVLVEQTKDAVVNISTAVKNKREQARHQLPDIPKNSPFYDFFRRFFDEDKSDFDSPDGREVSSLGSGFIISSDGYVITNHHVIDGADEIIVRLNDRRELSAEVIGSDKRSDIALLKVEATNLPTLKTGSSEQVKVGEWVLAIGSPFGFDYSVTAGIVSAKGRNLPGADNNYVPFIQTDVAINPGNSGGPLFNLNGEVVGMNAQIYSRTGGFMGLSFAIPIDTAMNVIAQLRENGKVSRGWLGVLIQDVDRKLAESFGMDMPKGALVAKVLDEGPAKAAGFKAGDIIIEFDGKTVRHSAELPPIVGESPVGKSVSAVIMRQGKREVLHVTLEELPMEEELRNAARGGATHGKLGLRVEDIDTPGVKVTTVNEGAAREAGIRVDDVILSLNNEDIEDAKHFGEIVAALEPGRPVPVLVQRGDSPVFLALRVPDEQ
jgi:serine protease Do